MTLSHLAFLQNLRAPEIILIFLVVLLLFGAKRLPELFRSFGKSIREFKKATSEIEDDIRTAMDEEPAVEAKPAAGQVTAESTETEPEIEAAEPAATDEAPAETENKA
ncbi:MAG: twin-arginine translocase TatA/TatE family subunit [Verrucomicrobia bacterium]|nr:twin-arginine translocase TatA/TatE family subunit [Verrucomicrobiota bacterium]